MGEVATKTKRKIFAGFEQLSKERFVPAVWLAFIYTGLGEKDKAFEWLEKGLRAARSHANGTKGIALVGSPALRPALPGPPAPHEFSAIGLLGWMLPR
jgi:hypothetical protein